MLKELFGELETRRKSRELEFWSIAHKLAAGEKVGAAAVERLLTESGKTPAELERTVSVIQQRRQWHELVSTEPALEKERATLKDRIAAEDRKLAAAEKAHTDATEPMYARLDFLKARVSEASDARRRLMDTCPYAELKGELTETQRLLNAQRQRHAELKREADRAELVESDLAEAQLQQDAITPGSHPRNAAYWRDRAERNRTAGERAAAELPKIEKEIARLEKEESAIYGRMIKP
ncbi:MAG TPA: hypothetical protein PKC49_05010 [Phycisphaerae bacterium]|nr:hypothetical protein [Phycisphaerae bacterium]